MRGGPTAFGESMSGTDIIARLKLNATGFSNEINKSLGDVERRFSSTGTTIGRNLSSGIGSGLQDVSSRIPVLGGALAGLSGPALVAAGAIGAVGLAMGKGLGDAEEYTKAVKGLGAVFTATGNNTGLAQQQLVDFAEEMESAWAIAAEEIIGAEKVLTSFSGVAGTTFKRAIVAAADMSAVFGGDLSSNTEKLGLVLQNLAQGSVAGLSKGFKLLGPDTIATIEHLAEMGRTAEAQTALLDALQKKVGGAADSQAQGLSGAYDRLTDAIGDANRELVVQSGLYDGAVGGLESVTAGVDALVDKLRELGGLKGVAVEVMAAFASPLGYATDPKYREKFREGFGVKRPSGGSDNPLGLTSFFGKFNEDLTAAYSATSEYYSRDRTDPDKAKKKSDQNDKEADQRKRITDAIAKETAELEHQVEIGKLRAQGLDYEADLNDALFRLYQQFSGVERERLANLEARVREQVDLNALIREEKALEDGAKNAQRVSRQANDEYARQKEEMERQAQEQINDLADFYESAMGKGNGSIWKQFKAEGKRVIAEIAAYYTLQLISGQRLSSISDVISGLSQFNGVFSGQGGGLLNLASGLFKRGADGIGAGTFGGSVSGPGLTQLTGLTSSAAASGGISAALSGIAAAAGPVGAVLSINSMVSDLLGNDQIKGGKIWGLVSPVLTALFGKAKKGSATLGFDGGELGVISTRGNSNSRIKAASDAGGNVADTLRDIAEQLGGDLNGTVSTSIGVRKKSYRVDTTGQGRTKGAGVESFGKDQDAAIEAAIQDALQDGVITGISAASKKIIASGKDLQKSIEKAALIESIPKQLKAIEDPVGAAIDEFNKGWEKTIAALKEGGASAAQWADAQKLYGLELAQVKKQAIESADGLKLFLQSLNFGSSSPLSLRDQEAAARSALQPFLDKIASGQSIDQQAYQSAAQSFLDIERGLYGSTDKFFAEFDAIKGATAKAISAVDNAAVINAENPFVKATAEATKQTASAAQATADILAQNTQILADVRTLLGRYLTSPVSAAPFIGTVRGFR